MPRMRRGTKRANAGGTRTTSAEMLRGEIPENRSTGGGILIGEEVVPVKMTGAVMIVIGTTAGTVIGRVRQTGAAAMSGNGGIVTGASWLFAAISSLSFICRPHLMLIVQCERFQ